MIACSHCGFRNMDGETRCLKCQSLLVDDDQEVHRSLKRANHYSTLNALRDRVQGLQTRLLRLSGWHHITALPQDYVPYRLPGAAAALTLLLPGLGQLYNHQPRKVAAFAGAWWLLFIIAILTITHPYSNWILLATLVGWGALWTDAYVSAARVNGQTIPPRTAIAILFGILAVAFASITIAQTFGGNFFTLKTVFTGTLSPMIRSGDLVLVNHWSYFFRSPRAGEVLQFDPPRFTMEVPGPVMSDVTSVNMTDYFQRVLAVAGDKVERRNGVCYVNGEPLAPEWDAAGARLIGDHAPFTVPEGRVYAPITAFPGDVFQVIAEAMGADGQNRVGRPGVIYKGLEQAGLPGRKEWLSRALFIANPPPHRTWFGPRP